MSLHPRIVCPGGPLKDNTEKVSGVPFTLWVIVCVCVVGTVVCVNIHISMTALKISCDGPMT